MARFSVRIISTAGNTIMLLALLFPAILFAAPVEVTFFPNSARMTEMTRVRLQPAAGSLKKAVFTLPGQADPDSLVTRVAAPSRAVIEDQTWRQVSRQDEETIRALKKKIEDLKEERIKVQSGIKSLDTQVQFWQMQTKAKFKTLADATNMSAALGKNIKKAMMEKLAMEPELEKLDKRIHQLQEDLNAAGGKKETVWEVAVLMTGAQETDITLTYTYSLAGCGWTPLYRLEARPLDRQVLFSWEGEIWQSAAQDWSQVVVHLANMQPKSALAPRELPPWVIKPRPLPVAAGTAKKAKAAPRAAEAMLALDMEAKETAAPTLTKEGAYTAWALGKRSIAAGARQRVKVLEETWPAEFTYLCRPSQDDQVFVRAMARFTEAREIPRGSALFLIDGAIVGKRAFAASSREETIFFGTDPMVRAKTVLLTQKSGEKTLFQDKQTYLWDWRIDLENNRSYPIKMRVEEPLPQSRDERIKITLTSDPQPTEKTDAIQTWVVDIPAADKGRILHGVHVEAPKDMPVDLGWRR